MKTESSQVLLSKYARRLTTEGLLKALFLSLTIAFGVTFVVAAITWFKGIDALLLCVGILLGITAIGVPIFYFAAFRPTLKGNAKRIDRLGLEERTITMLELENEDSIFARLQREDARSHLEQINEKMLKIRLARKLVVSTAVTAFLTVAMIVVSVLTSLGYLMSGVEMMAPILPQDPIEYVYVEFFVEEGGYIDGEEFQEIIRGGDTTEVMAVAEDGWIFVGWDDGLERPERMEFGVTQDAIYVAIFEPVEDEGDSDGDGDGDGEGEGSGTPSDQPGEGDGQTNQESQDGENSNEAGGGRYQSANQALDGKTYYRDVMKQYEDMIFEYLTSGEEVPEDVRKIIETYLEIIG